MDSIHYTIIVAIINTIIVPCNATVATFTLMFLFLS